MNEGDPKHDEIINYINFKIFYENSVLTYKLLSNELSINMNTSKQYLKDYTLRHLNQLNIYYILTYKGSNNEHIIEIIQDIHLDSKVKSMKNIISLHVHSLSRKINQAPSLSQNKKIKSNNQTNMMTVSGITKSASNEKVINAADMKRELVSMALVEASLIDYKILEDSHYKDIIQSSTTDIPLYSSSLSTASDANYVSTRKKSKESESLSSFNISKKKIKSTKSILDSRLQARISNLSKKRSKTQQKPRKRKRK
jgi:hypothetical protein